MEKQIKTFEEFLNEKELEYPWDESGKIELKRKVLLQEIPKLEDRRYKLVKLTDWGFWDGDVMVSIDDKIAKKIIAKLKQEVKYAPEQFLDELAEFII